MRIKGTQWPGLASDGCPHDAEVHRVQGCVVLWSCVSEEGLGEGAENNHKVQCSRIKEQRELYKEKKKEEAMEEAEEINERLRLEFEMLRGDGASSSLQE